MTRFGKLWTLLTGEELPEVIEARGRRAAAKARREDALRRGDDRDFGRASMELLQATNDELRAGRT